MADKELEEKTAYFKDQDLLDISDDEDWFPNEGFVNTERAFAGSEIRPPPSPRLARQRCSFLGPPPRERQAEFETHTSKQRGTLRPEGQGLVRSTTAPEAAISTTFPLSIAKPKPFTSAPEQLDSRKTLKHSLSLPDLIAGNQLQDQTPFYKQAGVIPRPLGTTKKAKPVDIKLEPERKQLLRGKIIYFFPNDDISQARRMRLHKLIQLGAAWVREWREDITHIMVEDGNHTYSQLLRHLNKPGLPCIQFGTLLDPTPGRFLVKGAPPPKPTTVPAPTPSSTPQPSLRVKPSRKKSVNQGSRKIDFIPVKASFPPLPSSYPVTPTNSYEKYVKDSFPLPCLDPIEKPTNLPDSYNDALSEAIQQTKAVSHLPLDEEDLDVSPSILTSPADQDSFYDGGTDVETTRPSPKRQKKSFPKSKLDTPKGFNQSSFQCMQPSPKDSSQDPNPNARTIQVLEEMCKYYDQMGDQWRTLAYRRGVGTLRKQDHWITTKEQAVVLPFIGTRLAEKIEEIALTNRLNKLENTRDDPTDQTLRLFMGIYGVGLSQANKWIQAGYHTLDDLVAKAKLTDSQKIGIERWEDFATRIPRAEVEAHGAFMRGALARIDPGFQVTVMGSYRRGAKDSGDIDMIITKPGANISVLRTVVFDTLIPRLFAAGFLKCALATSHRTNDGTKWLGASCLPGSEIWRRLDLLLVPEEEMGAALIYFTGNDIFNRSLRLLASKKGMRLNQKGLYKDVIKGKNREKLNEGTLVESKSEKKIFEILGVPWRAPTERIC
ncbi:uncharacterized protein BDR25DRAFT_333623 [Lindgomyces ingoldianus]|uniref:Uncharacterized protein n=1 Tax=Lindgomyces ingoldianus TaxID=673940 RepID=A0ACB6QZ35_9PLEO|nr:uncharacterized protein BDR25DRAFT_333623 [Lindgomyces ingoldianus]KAF2472258.1 hypothetical protein BDR25DRAFT_333623 [Lindgomyces ingoldianus]